jgi:hypothetical protein
MGDVVVVVLGAVTLTWTLRLLLCLLEAGELICADGEFICGERNCLCAEGELIRGERMVVGECNGLLKEHVDYRERIHVSLLSPTAIMIDVLP